MIEELTIAQFKKLPLIYQKEYLDRLAKEGRLSKYWTSIRENIDLGKSMEKDPTIVLRTEPTDFDPNTGERS